MSETPLIEVESISVRVDAAEIVVVVRNASHAAGEHADLRLRGDDIRGWPPDQRLLAGLYESTGAPAPVPAVRTRDLVNRMMSRRQASPATSRHRIEHLARSLRLTPELVDRPLDAPFTASEAIAIELFQLAIAEPDAAILDLSSVHLDRPVRDALTHGLRVVRSELPSLAILVITTEPALITDLSPARVCRPDGDVAISDPAKSAPALLG